MKAKFLVVNWLSPARLWSEVHVFSAVWQSGHPSPIAHLLLIPPSLFAEDVRVGVEVSPPLTHADGSGT